MVLNPTKKNVLFNEDDSTGGKKDILSDKTILISQKRQHLTFKNRRDSSKNSGRQISFNKVISQLNQNTKSKSRDTKHNTFKNLQASLRFFHSRKLKFLGEARNINKSIQSLKNASLGVSNLSPKSNTPVKESEAIAQSDVPLKPMQLVITPLKKKSKISCTAMDIRPLMDKRFCEESRGVKEYVNKFKKNDDKFCKIRKKFKKLIVYKKKLNRDKDENLDYDYPTRNVSRLGSISKNSTNNPHDDCVQKQVNISQSGKNKISRNKSFKSSVKFSSLCKCALITKYLA
ncbi:unnamed protein product [Moneuplotes crassus]|uniref:Uncharacterized protein n=1 Tax=Euplotes crassus TaxID=5936 RepID=A0AAD2D9W2_EUPCR|nr:unnamed protein product [Moneuplotes crassus]